MTDIDATSSPHGESVPPVSGGLCSPHVPPYDFFHLETVRLPSPVCIEGGCQAEEDGLPHCGWDECLLGTWDVPASDLDSQDDER